MPPGGNVEARPGGPRPDFRSPVAGPGRGRNPAADVPSR